MGEVIFWTIVRIAVIIPVLWWAEGYFHTQFWWTIGLLAIYGIVIQPAVVHYRLFKTKNKDIIESTLCSTCKHFDESAVLCMLHDKHPTKAFLPCEGVDWEPRPMDVDNEDIFRS